MAVTRVLLEKLRGLTISKRELDTLLGRLGFQKFRGRGSHEVWGHVNYPDIHMVIATHGKDVPRYQLRQILKSLEKRGLS